MVEMDVSKLWNFIIKYCKKGLIVNVNVEFKYRKVSFNLVYCHKV